MPDGPWNDYGGPWQDYTPAQPASGGLVGLAKAFGSGALGTIESAAHQLNLADPKGWATDIQGGADLATGAAQAVGAMSPQQGQQVRQKVADLRAAVPGHLGETAQEEQQRSGLYHAPANTGERIAETAGAMAPGIALGPEADVGSILRALPARVISQVAAPTAGSEIAGDVAHTYAPNLEPAARMAGAIAGGGLGGAAEVGARGLMNTVAKSPLVAAVSRGPDGAAGLQAGLAINKAATDPDAAAAALAAGPDVKVPGSTPTVGQQTGDLGLLAREKALAQTNPAPFRQRQADQSVAQTGTLQQLEPEGSPVALASALKTHFDQLDAATQAHVDTLTAAAKDRAEAIGGTATPEAYGNDIRNSLVEAEQASRARESALWNAVDPTKDLTGNTVQTSVAARDIGQNMRPTEKPMDGEEAAIFDQARNLEPLAPAADLVALRQRLNAAMSEELANSGRTPSYARMSQLNGAISDNLATTISHQVANDETAVGKGALAPDASMASKVKGWVDDYRTQQQAEAGVGGAGGPSGAPSVATPGGAGPDGTGLPPSGRPPSAPSDQGLPPDGSGPTFDAAAQDRLAAANAATRERGRTFGIAPISNITDTLGYKGVYKLPDGSVPAKAFHPGPSGFDDAQRVLTASPSAQPVLEDYAAANLRAAAMRDDGTLDPAKFTAWQKRYADALRALPPETQARFGDAASATLAIDEASAARADALKAAQTGAAGRLMNAQDPAEVTNRVGQVFSAPDAQAQMRALAARAADDPVAMQGLRRSVVDFMLQRFISNREAGTSGENEIAANAFQNFVKKSSPALGEVFSPAEMTSMQNVAADIQRAARSVTAAKIAGGSDSVQNIMGVLKAGGFTKASTIMDGLAAGMIEGATHNWVLASMGAVGAHLIQLLRESGIRTVNDLQAQALLDPVLGRQLMRNASALSEPAIPKLLAKTLQRSSAVAGPAALNANSDQ